MTDFESLMHDISDKAFTVLNAKMEDESLVFEHIESKIPDGCRAVVFYGDNASGKSFLGKVTTSILKSKGYATRSCSMSNRTSGMAGGAFIFGDESYSSTGVNSYQALKKMLNSSQKDSGNSISVLDEADLGLSPRYSRALGDFVASKLSEMDGGKFVVIISHDTALISSFIGSCKLPVAEIGINTKMSLSQWLSDGSSASLDELEALEGISLKKFRAIQSELK
ncbi:TPA: hypothetical protein ACPVZG_000569 [Vibrio parahaemolyticus]